MLLFEQRPNRDPHNSEFVEVLFPGKGKPKSAGESHLPLSPNPLPLSAFSLARKIKGILEKRHLPMTFLALKTKDFAKSQRHFAKTANAIDFLSWQT